MAIAIDAINNRLRTLRLRFANSQAGRFFRWWFKALYTLLPAAIRARLKDAHRRLLIRTGQGEISLSIESDSSVQALDTVPANEDPQLQHQHVQQLLQQHELEEVNRVLLLAETEVLRTRVAMPMAAETNLRQALAYEMDRHTPFQAGEVFYDWRVLKRDRDAGQLGLELIVVPREAVEADIELLQRLGLAPSGVDVAADDGTLGINLLPEAMRHRIVNQQARTNWLAGAVTVLLLALVMAQSLLLREHQLTEIKAAIEDVKAEAMAVQQIRKQIDDASEAADFLQKHRAENGYKVEMMAELTRILPQDTYLDRLNLQADSVQMQGKSGNAQALIELVNASPMFENASFRGPTRLDPRSNKEIFDLNAKVTRGDAG
jgi:general secretion pathway protein L